MAEKNGAPFLKIFGCCCGCLVLAVVLVFAAGGAGFFGLIGAMRNSDAVDEAVEIAARDPRVIEALGEPIEKGLLVSGSIDVRGSSGDADLTIPISGPKGEAKLYAIGEKFAGEWHYQRIEVEVEPDGERFRLEIPALENASPAPGSLEAVDPPRDG